MPICRFCNNLCRCWNTDGKCYNDCHISNYGYCKSCSYDLKDALDIKNNLNQLTDTCSLMLNRLSILEKKLNSYSTKKINHTNSKLNPLAPTFIPKR